MTSIRHTTRNEGAAKSTCDRDLVLKILVIGGPGCGKTSLIRRYVHDAFHSTMRATVGVDFALKQVHRGGGCQVLQLWDVAGQERNSTTTRVYFQAALGAMVVCGALTRPLIWPFIGNMTLTRRCLLGLMRSEFLCIPCW